ncbi:hypothetical protein QAD02_016120 [Eretmocerus hayati]|uniref:Uncharacterized protein n=1 Tax=Eretmocerus hayati TaxID=131215 RepID=A0ACC2PA68_9HYME|nr:hypothetical protein QAD02_016120 [Eretmocerus hayati]
MAFIHLPEPASIRKIRFIGAAVERRPALHNPMDMNFRNATYKRQQWREVAAESNFEFPESIVSGEDMKRAFKLYHSTWNKYQNRLIHAAEDGLLEDLGERVALGTLVQLRSVHFLIHFSRHADGAGNIDIRRDLDTLISMRRTVHLYMLP